MFILFKILQGRTKITDHKEHNLSEYRVEKYQDLDDLNLCSFLIRDNKVDVDGKPYQEQFHSMNVSRTKIAQKQYQK